MIYFDILPKFMENFKLYFPTKTLGDYMTRLLTFIAILIFSIQVFATDPFNTYRWDRKNFERGVKTQGSNPWYEWWYYKVVLPETGESYCFVYGVVNPWDSAQGNIASRSYVGFGDFKNRIIIDQKFPVSQFEASYDQVYVNVADNIATDINIKGMAQEDNNFASWDIDIQHKWTFNATSWATGKQITNIEWYPAQADARCSGTITSQNKTRTFENAPCYQDRNWGYSFPDWWAWIVSNQFENHPNTALAVGGGKPIFWKKFKIMKGVAIGLKHKGKEYFFRPNEFHKVKIDINFGKWEMMGKNKTHKIEITAWAPAEEFMNLEFMTPDGEIFHDYETLTGKSIVKLYKKVKGFFFTRWELMETLKSNYTGIEYGSKNTYQINELLNRKINLFSNF